jgi:hypothetical protein
MSTHGWRISAAFAALSACTHEANGPASDPVDQSVTAPLHRARACNAGGAPRKDHYGLYRPATATFTLENQRPGWNDVAPSETTFVYGNQSWRPLIGDWNGDGTETAGVWHGGTFALRNSNSSGFADNAFVFGNPTDVPIVGDWIGVGTTTVGVFRSGWWYLRYSNTTGVADSWFAFGNATDVPVVGDWDGDGIDTVGVFRDGTWFLKNTNSPGPPDITVSYGDPGAIPIVGDWDGDGVDTVGVYANGWLFLKNTNTSGIADISIRVGAAGDIPIAGNWSVAGDGYGNAAEPLRSFFPLAADLQPTSSFPHWKDLGMNTLIREVGDIDLWTQAANTAGLRMIRSPRPVASADNNERGLLAWMAQDEIDGQGDPQIAPTQNAYRSLKSVNPRPYLINFGGDWVLNPTLPASGPGICNGPGDTGDETCYPGFLAAEDWVSHDIYPFKSYAGDISVLTRTLDKLRRWAGGKPQFAYIGLTAIYGDSGFVQPTPAQVTATIWAAIVHGARGIFYFPHGNCDPCTTNDSVPPDVAAEVKRQNATITSLTDTLQSAVNPAGFGVDAMPPLEAGWRFDGAGGTYLIVVNTSGSTVNAVMPLCGPRPTAPITVYGENRTVGMAGLLSVQDMFAPYAVHIYVVR